MPKIQVLIELDSETGNFRVVGNAPDNLVKMGLLALAQAKLTSDITIANIEAQSKVKVIPADALGMLDANKPRIVP